MIGSQGLGVAGSGVVGSIIGDSISFRGDEDILKYGSSDDCMAVSILEIAGLYTWKQ